jgi:hypothetical protein
MLNTDETSNYSLPKSIAPLLPPERSRDCEGHGRVFVQELRAVLSSIIGSEKSLFGMKGMGDRRIIGMSSC